MTIVSTHSLDNEGNLVSIAVHVATASLPSFDIVGAAGERVRETRDRVRAAIINSDLTWPNRRVTVSILPERAYKAGPVSPRYDLAIALGVVAATEPFDTRLLGDLVVVSELHMDGGLCRGSYRFDNGSHLIPLVADDQELGDYTGIVYREATLAGAVALLNRLERVS